MPIPQYANMMLASTYMRTLVISTNSLSAPDCKNNIKKLATKNAIKIAYASTGESLIKLGLGITSWINSAPSITAVTISPGIPNAIIVINAPPAVALLADSGAMMPSAQPVPNSCGFFDAFFA